MAVILAVAGVALVAGPAKAAFNPWRRVDSPRYLHGSGSWDASAALSGSDAWMVGSGEDPAMVVHWNGTSWHKQAAPVGTGHLTSIAAITPTDVWAGADHCDGGFVTCLIHYDGAGWHAAASFRGSLSITIAARRADDVWALVAPLRGVHPLAYHWDGVSWSHRAFPRVAGTAVSDVTWMPGTEQFWACGSGTTQDGDFTPAVWHFSGGRWRSAAQRIVDGGALYAITATAGGNVWTAGDISQSGPLVEHLTPDGWRESEPSLPTDQPVPTSYAGLTDIAASSPSDVWTVGYDAPDESTSSSVLAHFNGSTWKTYELPARFDIERTFSIMATVVHVPHTSQYSAGGYYYNTTLPQHQNRAVILRKE